MERVANVAKGIAKKEGGDPFVAEVAGWLHDVADAKLVDNQANAVKEQKRLLESLIESKDLILSIESAMKDISFRGKHKTPETLEGKIVQDADRLDAIGAIGIARTFAYGGKAGQLIHSTPTEDEKMKDNNTSIQHFYDKLLLLKDLMNTETARNMAQERHEFMQRFLEEFYSEWGSSN
ncbi:HD domain-containing protein [Pontibacillus sp. HMF3514]|nr:HD domain-containing protein [Pontibacillus sp. HMF3514]QHE52459.1 HD domain-containing protein [Pontibacillus sp. HMF3514]